MPKLKRNERIVSPRRSTTRRPPALSTTRAAAAGADVDRVPRSAAKRRAILEAAWELFPSRGFGGTGMRALAAEAGVSTATIYAHFSTKTDLIRALIQARWEQALRGTIERAAQIPDPLDRLLTGITHLNHAIAADPLLRQLLVTPRRIGDAEIEQEAAPIEDMMDARCTEAIRTAVAARRLLCRDPEALAVLIRVSMQGWLLTESKRRRPMREERLTRVLVDLIRGATARPLRDA
ncbi:MAG: TetR/AcrR family transcriptional regulator [bacterium]|nr:TetR/AcrR family transcriptional regulator [bacterium]